MWYIAENINLFFNQCWRAGAGSLDSGSSTFKRELEPVKEIYKNYSQELGIYRGSQGL